MLKFSFLGGAQEVGKSLIRMEFNGKSVILDAGVKLSEPVEYPHTPKSVDALILTHAHMDHSGMIPALHKKQSFPVYGTELTFEISHILQRDFVNVGKLKREKVPYSEKDIDRMITSEIITDYGRKVKLFGNIEFEFFDAGHIPGSASVLLDADGRKIFYTGDINTGDTRLQNGTILPEHADIVITESTYGDRSHPDRKKTENAFLDKVKEVTDRGNVALVPVFAVGRTQETLLILQDANLNVPVYLDGMGKTITRLTMQYSGCVRDAEKLHAAASSAIWVENERARRDICDEPCVIVTSAGMLDGGPVLSYLHKIRKNKGDCVLLTGYQTEDSNGRLLLDKGYVVDAMRRKKIKIECEVHQFDFSAHADREGLESIVKRLNPEHVICVHGDAEVCEEFAEGLHDYKTYVPKIGGNIAIE